MAIGIGLTALSLMTVASQAGDVSLSGTGISTSANAVAEMTAVKTLNYDSGRETLNSLEKVLDGSDLLNVSISSEQFGSAAVSVAWNYVAKREYGSGFESLANAPQAQVWLARAGRGQQGYAGLVLPLLNKDVTSYGRGVISDATAVAPLNLTLSRINYLRGLGLHTRPGFRFWTLSLVSRYVNRMTSLVNFPSAAFLPDQTMSWLQLSALICSSAPITDDEIYQREWRRLDGSKFVPSGAREMWDLRLDLTVRSGGVSRIVRLDL